MTFYWHGVNDATNETHGECFRRYARGCPDLASFRFEVRDDLKGVRITPDLDAANGIWTLAEIAASGEEWSTVAAVATRMRAAIDRRRE